MSDGLMLDGLVRVATLWGTNDWLDVFEEARAERHAAKLEAAKQWLKERGGGHPGCLERFMKERGQCISA